MVSYLIEIPGTFYTITFQTLYIVIYLHISLPQHTVSYLRAWILSYLLFSTVPVTFSTHIICRMKGKNKGRRERERRERLRPQMRNQFFWEGRCAREWRGLWVCPTGPESSFPGRAVAWVSPGGHLQGTESQKLLSPHSSEAGSGQVQMDPLGKN